MIEAGALLPARTFRITREDLVRYAAASGDHNPIHQDDEVARSVGLPGVIAHGMLTLGLVGRAVSEWAVSEWAQGDGAAEVVELGAKFVAPVVVPAGEGAEITVAGSVKSVVDDLATLALEVRCGETKVLGMPRAVVRVSAVA